MARVLTAASVDVTAGLISHLRTVVGESVGEPPVKIATQVPRSAAGELRFPKRMVRVSRAGGVMWSVAHDRPLIIVEVWADPSPEAARLAGVVREACLALDNTLAYVDGSPHVWLTHYAEVGGLADFPDPRTTMPRYQFTHQLTARAAATGATP